MTYQLRFCWLGNRKETLLDATNAAISDVENILIYSERGSLEQRVNELINKSKFIT